VSAELRDPPRPRAAPRTGGGPPTLATARLVLRPLAAGDTAAVATLAGDPRVAIQLDQVPSPFPPALAARWIARRNLRWYERKGVTLAITRQHDLALIGAISLRVSRLHRHAELGYWVGASAWGDGVATEAAAALIDWAFGALPLMRIHARVLADNPASRRVAEKLGLAVEGVRPGHYRKGDTFVDVIELGIGRCQWATRRADAGATATGARPPRSPSPRRSPRRPRRS
jgi:RimJ/RimL family protein N-acetyltransferase